MCADFDFCEKLLRNFFICSNKDILGTVITAAATSERRDTATPVPRLSGINWMDHGVSPPTIERLTEVAMQLSSDTRAKADMVKGASQSADLPGGQVCFLSSPPLLTLETTK